MSDYGLTPSGKSWQPPTPEELHGQLPQYEIEEMLGAGGMGAVYKGFQTSLERRVAIKILPPSFDEDRYYAQRFRQEAKTMARLSHPGIVGVHDCGQTASGLLYIVMEFVEGTDVQQMIRRQGRLPAEQAMAVTLHVCDALSYAHENGVVHRDIKPANIMVDMHGRVKVADFGLAKSEVTGTGLSSTAMTLGTPDYVAPEALVMGVKVDQRADVYSVGVMLYEMLTGKVPRGRFEPASARVPGLDPRYDQVIDRAMAEEREGRYGDASELKADLHKIRTIPLSESGMRSVAVQVGPASAGRRKARANAAPEKSKAPLVLVTAGPLAVAALLFLIWSPWAAKETHVDGTPGLESPVQTEVKPAANVAANSPAPPVKPPDAPMTVSVPKLDPPPKPELPPEPPTTVGAPDLELKVQPPIPTSLPAAPAPLSEVKLSLVKLDEQFQAAAEREVGAGIKTKESTLKREYVGALESAREAAVKEGKADAAQEFAEEKERIEKGLGVPPEAAEGDVSAKLKELRQTYRDTEGKLEAERLKLLQPLYGKFEQALASLETELTKAGRLDEAVFVKSFQARIPQLRLSGVTSCLNPAGRTVVADSEVKIAANSPVGHAMGALQKDDFICLSGVKYLGHAGMQNPGKPEKEGLVIAHASQGSHAGDVVQAVPEEAASSSFIYVVPADDEKWVLRIKTPGGKSGDPEKVTCRLKIIRPSEAMFKEATSTATVADSDYVNPLGMKFVRVPGTDIFMCDHDTRRKDYAAFAAENAGVDDSWKNPARKGAAFSKTEDDPVVCVSWEDAKAFCTWLGKKDGRVYRLPTDREWSVAVGIADYENDDASPESLDQKVKDMYPWGTGWPPPKDAGNSPNKLGLHDLGGHVWQWCEDWYDAQNSERVMHGGSWADNTSQDLLSSRRVHHPPNFRGDDVGFRCVVVEKAAAAPLVASESSSSPVKFSPPPAPKKVETTHLSSLINAHTNSLGMKFVAVPGTGVLMCIHETRKKDYAAYAVENPKIDESWKNPLDDNVPVSEGDDHPVVMVNWEDAMEFCAWLSKREGHLYRLPTDREWSFAVGVADREARGERLKNEYPWGIFWPPPKGAGNFADQSYLKKFPRGGRRKPLAQDDGFAGTAPVMSFSPNRLGIYDLAGNAWEWCLDASKSDRSSHILRGGAYNDSDPNTLLSTTRISRGPARYPFHGFRCVLDPR